MKVGGYLSPAICNYHTNHFAAEWTIQAFGS